jgi:hypothetical protein
VATQHLELKPERAAVALVWLDVGFNTPACLRAYLGRERVEPGLPVSDLAFNDPRWRARVEPKPTGLGPTASKATRLRAADPPGAELQTFKTDTASAYPTTRLSSDEPPVNLATYRDAQGRHVRVEYKSCKFGNAPSCSQSSRVQLVLLGALLRLVYEGASDLADTDPAGSAALRRFEFWGVVDDVIYLAEASIINTLHQTVLALHQRWQFPLQTAKLLVEGVPAQTFTYSGITMDLGRDS